MAMKPPHTTVKLSDALTAIMEDSEWWLHQGNFLFSGLLANHPQDLEIGLVWFALAALLPFNILACDEQQTT